MRDIRSDSCLHNYSIMIALKLTTEHFNMKHTNPELYEALQSHRFSHQEDELPFSQRLAQENSWSLDFSQRSIKEYKRFLYLATESIFPITPSDEIDQVWHLHLTYTQNYWEELCQKLLKTPLHHKPTKGGPTEQQRYKNQYTNTLRLYQETFGEEAPSDIWPRCEKRFANNNCFIRVNQAEQWIIKKPKKFWLPFAVLPITIAACTPNEDAFDFWFWAKAVIGIYVLYRILRWISGGGGSGGHGGGDLGGGSGCGTGCGGGCGS